MKNLILSDNEHHNLIMFLSRINLTGKEAFTFCSLVTKIEQAETTTDTEGGNENV